MTISKMFEEFRNNQSNMLYPKFSYIYENFVVFEFSYFFLIQIISNVVLSFVLTYLVHYKSTQLFKLFQVACIYKFL